MACRANPQRQRCSSRKQALAFYIRDKGDEHPDTLGATLNLAATLDNRGKYAEAELLIRKVVAHYTRVKGDEHPDTLGAIESLASMLQHQGVLHQCSSTRARKLDEAEALIWPLLAVKK